MNTLSFQNSIFCSTTTFMVRKISSFQVQGGYWFLGSMMCDIYSASDVACSTASILILTVISFDRLLLF